MTIEERKAIYERIDAMIGTYDQHRKYWEHMGISDRINARNRYEKLRSNLFKIAEKGGEKALATTLIQKGRDFEGVTYGGKKFIWTGNNGCTERSRYCGDLWVEGIGTVFTSGKVDKVFEYIINN